ncbi:MAG: right-handed parallel beta-helix repeat-containing protein [Solirubrobacterales bacterium]
MTISNRTSRLPRPLILAVFVVALVFALRMAGDSPEAGAQTYYLDSRNGDDTVEWPTPKSPWRSFARLMSVRLGPGDVVKLRSGSVWREQLRVTGSGTDGRPIAIGRYGKGERPRITGSRDCVVISGDNVRVSGLVVDRCGNAAFTLSGYRDSVRHSRLTRSAIGVYATASSRGADIWRNYIARNNIMFTNTREPKSDDAGAFGVLLHGVGAEVAYNTIDGHSAASFDFGRDGSAVELYGAKDSRIHHNRASNNQAFVELGLAGTAGNVVSRNTITSNRPGQYGLITRGPDEQFGPVLDTKFERNRLTMTGRGSIGFVCSGGCGPEVATFTDNVFDIEGDGGFADFRPRMSGNIFRNGKLEIGSER